MLKKILDYLVFLEDSRSDGEELGAKVVCSAFAIPSLLTLIGCIKLIAMWEVECLSDCAISVLLFIASLLISFLVCFIPSSIVLRWVFDELSRREEQKKQQKKQQKVSPYNY